MLCGYVIVQLLLTGLAVSGVHHYTAGDNIIHRCLQHAYF